MHIRYVIPGPMGRSKAGAAELRQRRDLLISWAAPGTEVSLVDADSGPESVESAYEDHLSVPLLAAALVTAEREGVDALIIGCYDDPGSDAMRELATRTIVVGPAVASMHVAALGGTQIGIATVPEPGAVRRLIYASRMSEHVHDIAVIRSSVLDLREDVGHARAEVRAAAEKLIDAGADVIVLGCMSLSFLTIDEALSVELGVPVVNPGRVAPGTAELLVRARLHPSKIAYPTPTKIQQGVSLGEFVA